MAAAAPARAEGEGQQGPSSLRVPGLVAAEDLRPRAERAPVAAVDNGALTEADMMQLVVAAVEHEGLAGHNIRAFNELMNVGIPKILSELFHPVVMVKDVREQTEQDRQRESVRIEIRFYGAKVGRPVYPTYPIGKFMPLYPNESRLSGRTYAAPLSLAAEVTLTAYYADGREETKRAEIPPFQVAPIPIMVGSDRCHTWNLTREGRKALKEDPNESGGYFLAKGGEWVVDWLENISFNQLHVHARMAPNERVRGEFISQPGGAFEHSSQVIIRYMVSGALTIEINSVKFSKTRIPFFLIFRLLGMTSDRDVLEQAVYDPASASPVARHMADVVGRALQLEDPAYAAVHHELDREKLTEFMAVRLSKFVTNPTAYKNNEHAVQYLNANLLGILDRVLLPHMGRDAASRGLKLRYLGMLIHKTLLVDMGILEPTDRDSYSNKRVHGAGVSIAKAFKTQFNNSVATPVMRSLKRELRNTPFEELSVPNIIGAFKGPMASSDLGRTLEQAITSGNKTIMIRRRAVVNRVSTQALERKNTANYYSALRGVSTHNAKNASKQTERADKMRRVHATYTGYICVARSADTGEMVGMKKELAITASVCSAGEALPLVLRLLEDPAVTAADQVRTPDLVRKNLACVFVNGRWIGCCQPAHELVARYRALRRESRIVDPQTSIVWNPVTDDVEFLLDVGRLTRPLLIVDNNIAAYDAACRARARAPFVQNIRLTPAHVAALRAGALSLEDLRARGVLEWITPEEAENCLVAPSLAALRAAAGDVTMRYTHCDVEQAIFGLTALISPFGNHTQPARVTYETNQGRQAGGWYSFAAPFRADKGRFFQNYCEAALVRTVANNWLFPNGMNTTVAYMINGGYNQEDSAVVKKAFVQRAGFAGAFYRYEKAELEKGEFFGSPDVATTKNLKPNASYEKLVDGFVPPGTVVQKGDVLIGRVAKIPAAGGRRVAHGAAPVPDDGFKFVDRSVVYHRHETAVVEEVLRPRGPNDNIFGLVKLRYYRPLAVGDKLCLTPDHDVLTARGWVPIAEVTMEDEVAALGPGKVLSYERPTALHAYDHDGDIYEIRSQAVSLRVTLNHRMYVKRRPARVAVYDYALIPAAEIMGKRVRYKRDAVNAQAGHGTWTCYGGLEGGADLTFPMDAWARLLGMFIADGWTSKADQVILSCKKVRKIEFLTRTADSLGLVYVYRAKDCKFTIYSRQVCEELRELSVGAVNKRLPSYVWTMSQDECRALLDALIEGDGHRQRNTLMYYTSSTGLADDVMRLALHAGWSGTKRLHAPAGTEATMADGRVLGATVDSWRVGIVRAKNEPQVNHGHTHEQKAQTERVTNYVGKVHCLAIPSHVFYVRRHGLPLWTGNSSRAGNKSICALLLPDSDMPFDEDGITPDIIINPHCLAGETPVMLACGLSRRIDALAAGESVWGWTPAGLERATLELLMPKGVGPVLELFLEDGRTVRATSGHPFLASLAGAEPQWVLAGDLRTEHRVTVGLEGPLDEPGPDEAGWTLNAGSLALDMAEGRDRALAFARVLGLVYSDGCLGRCKASGAWVFRAVLGSALDCEAFLDDIERLTARRPAVYDANGVFSLNLPRVLARALAAVPGMPTGAYIDQASTWPEFLGTAPKALLREFLGGLFGGDGHAPCLVKIKASTKSTAGRTLKGVAFEQSATRRTSGSMQGLMVALTEMLERVGVPGCRVYGPIVRANQRAAGAVGDQRRVQWGVRCPPATNFAKAVGFRFCTQKAARLSAASSYWRMLESVKRQHNHVVANTTLMYEDDADCTLAEARELAVELLALDEPLLNPYYSAPPMSVINNRRRSAGRKKVLQRLDFARIDTPVEFFRRAGCLEWFFIEGVTGIRRAYVVERRELRIPTFTLAFAGARSVASPAAVYDISVPGPTSFVANGIVVSNSIPSRMTIGQMLETSLGLRCQEEGVLTDGTSFRTISIDEVSKELEAIGLRFNGLSRMYNGRTGEHYDAAIFMGPTYHQRLQKFVKDDEYAVGGYGPTDALTGQPLEGKNARGGLRIGEMEAWVLEAQGAMMTLTEKMLCDSDHRKQFLCRTCGLPAIYNAHQGVYRCNTCGEGADIGAADSCKASIAFQHEIRATNVKLTLGTRPREFEVDE